MSGTSRDGIDAALIRSNGENDNVSLGFFAQSYGADFEKRLADICVDAMAMEQPVKTDVIANVEAELTALHAEAVASLLEKTGYSAEQIDFIGFHGHTIGHKPHSGWTWQIGDGAALAKATGINVVADLRSADVANGGQGAPLLPGYHRALSGALEKPVIILNLGGVANISYIGNSESDIIAGDTGMANGLINDWVLQKAGLPYDKGGEIASRGKVDEAILSAMLCHDYFTNPFPKSIDRLYFSIAPVSLLSLEDGAATLTAFTAKSIAISLAGLPERPKAIYAAGGGRHNPVLCDMIAQYCDCVVHNVDILGWNGDALEAEGFAWMAVRSHLGLPFSWPGTTGAKHPVCGGVFHRK